MRRINRRIIDSVIVLGVVVGDSRMILGVIGEFDGWTVAVGIGTGDSYFTIGGKGIGNVIFVPSFPCAKRIGRVG